ncbi:MAG: TrkH family potassium uptake protein [Candidatus Cloacimonadaceae bacterium]|jgi:trk system potassium uptake protein TrkH|nr:TrkH family potassium uptake protein [Candidatus Cloacimonadota bacterium]MDX9949074.1 TrkH family potassium uptake protein [Candidatus Syntrophosphaera sp.]
MRKFIRAVLSQVEWAAYLLAIWSLLVLFLEPVISHYADYNVVQNWTAGANLVFLGLAILSRLVLKTGRGIGKTVWFDLVMLVLGTVLMVFYARIVIFFLLIRQTFFILDFFIFRLYQGKVYKWLSKNPPVSLMLSFLLVILIGTVLLMLPVANTRKEVTPVVDALFTATSATCVTGLTVYDVGSYFSKFGQIVILILIQIGGLGIMTVSTAFALLLGRNIDLKLKNVMSQVVGGTNKVNVLHLLKNIVILTVSLELVGALILMAKFLRGNTLSHAIYLSVFHSVSAFCNAGFSVFPDNMARFGGSAIVSLVIPALIILGGLGFTTIIDLLRYFFKKDRVNSLNLHTKIVLVTTSVLILGGMLSFLTMEYHVTMKGFTAPQRFLSSFFQSVTLRTAGFSSLDFGAMSKASIFVSMILMFIGASPGSTGGGIKTTTFAVLGLTMVSLLKGRKDISVFGRRIPSNNFREAAGLVFLSAAILFFAVLALLLVEPFSLDKLLFEAVSAFGTVGLSMGITPYLSPLGRILITFLMYVGRIGPLTLIYAFAVGSKKTNIKFAEETIAIG